MILARLKATLYDNLSLSAKLALKEVAFQIRGKSTMIVEEPCVLVFDERIPTPDRDAGSLRMMRILSIIRQKWKVIFVPFTNRGEHDKVLTDIGVTVADVGEYRRLLKNPRVVAAIVSRPTMAELFTSRIRSLNPKARIIFDTVDVHFVRLQREYELTGDADLRAEAGEYRQAETRLARDVDAIWCASVDDERNIRREVGDCESVVVPTLHDLHGPGPGFSEREGLLFVGSFAHRPNADAVLYFLREILSIVEQSMPGIPVHIVGADPSDEIRTHASDHVYVHGFMPDLEPLLASARVFVAPLRYGGAGTKGKVGEALAHGIPVVCTSIGAEGFGLTSGKDAMIADEPKNFADAVCKLYPDQAMWEKLAAHGRARIEAYFTPAAVSAKIYGSIDPAARLTPE
jgi:glycosyltransferase involved in cell wall biosynthesis